MQRKCALGAQQDSCAGAPTGFRRLISSLLQTARAAAAEFPGRAMSIDGHPILFGRTAEGNSLLKTWIWCRPSVNSKGTQ